MKQRAVFLDRDGVLNRAHVREGKPYPPGALAELEILPGVPESLARLKAAGYRLIVVTNQPDVARGSQQRRVVEAINAALQEQLPLDDMRVCYHDNNDRCSCRKPAPGLLFEAARDYELNLAASFMIGDRWRDIEAGQRAGCTSIYINRGYTEQCPRPPFVHSHSLAEAVDHILSLHWINNENDC